jgi:putative IMPACT (imprinted ancient) family translation regulator
VNLQPEIEAMIEPELIEIAPPFELEVQLSNVKSKTLTFPSVVHAWQMQAEAENATKRRNIAGITERYDDQPVTRFELNVAFRRSNATN